jgi:hypothetical protein
MDLQEQQQRDIEHAVIVHQDVQLQEESPVTIVEEGLLSKETKCDEDKDTEKEKSSQRYIHSPDSSSSSNNSQGRRVDGDPPIDHGPCYNTCCICMPMCLYYVCSCGDCFITPTCDVVGECYSKCYSIEFNNGYPYRFPLCGMLWLDDSFLFDWFMYRKK